ncbi:MAG: nuclear transport factor 2 family protein, partial [Bacteroidota bacterium]
MEQLVKEWFAKWNSGDYLNLPISENFKHTSPFGTIEGRKAYLDLVKENEDKFLGYVFEMHDALYEKNRACVRYTGSQGDEFKLDVSEWFYPEGDKI